MSMLITKRKLFLGLSSVFLIGIVLEIWTANRLSSYGEQISRLEAAKADLQIENQNLQNKIDQQSSLAQIEQYSKQFGFTQVNHVQYVGPAGLALNH